MTTPTASEPPEDNGDERDSDEQPELTLADALQRALQEALEEVAERVLEGEMVTTDEGLPETGDRQAIIRASVQRMMFSGPIPPPALLREYDEIVPGFAARIIDMAERQQANNHEFNISRIRVIESVTSSDERRTTRGMGFVGIFMIMGIGLAIGLASAGFIWPAVATFLGDLLLPTAVIFAALIQRARNKGDD